MPLLRFMFAACVCAAMVGCANRPSVENYARFDTVDIVQKIRCELRDALRGLIISFLRRRIARDQTPLSFKRKYAAIISGLAADENNYRAFFENADRELHPSDARVVRRYEVAAFAYEFTFDLKENNDLDGGADFLDILTRGTFKLGITASKKRERKLLRNFKLLDQLKELASSLVMNRVCRRLESGSTHGYPITGKLRLDETVGTFFTLIQSGGLVGGITNVKPGAGAPKVGEVPAMADTLTFTTELSSTLSPSIELNTVGTNFQLTKANINSTNTRTDVHKLVFVSALPPRGTLAPKTVVAARALRELERQRDNENREEIIDNLLND